MYGGPCLDELPVGSTLGLMVGLDGDLSLFVNDKKYPARVRIPNDIPLYVVVDLYMRARQVTILGLQQCE